MATTGQTYDPIAHATAVTPADTTTVSTLTPPSGAVAALITVETTDARVTFDGSAPSQATPVGHVLKNGVSPVLVPCADSIKWVSTAAAACRVNVLWLG